MNNKTITIQMGENDLTFQVTLEAYNQCVNSLQTDNKIAPMHNFLVNVSANDETKKAVTQVFQDALTSELFGVLVKEYKPDIEITVKKSKPEQGK